MSTFQNPEVEAVFNAYPETVRANLLALRQLILDVATSDPDIGPLQETLKWGQPSYLTTQTKSGTTVRIGQLKDDPSGYGMFVHCQTTLVSAYRELYADQLSFDGNRCVRFKADEKPEADILRHCIRMALTYHIKKKEEGLPF